MSVAIIGCSNNLISLTIRIVKFSKCLIGDLSFLDWWSFGLLYCWIVEVVDVWISGTLDLWIFGLLELLNVWCYGCVCVVVFLFLCFLDCWRNSKRNQ